jgi:hypothetical protein
MDIIDVCFALAPIPCLDRAFSIFRFIWDTIHRVQLGVRQLQALAISVAQLLRILDGEIRSGRLVESQISPEVDVLQTSVAASCYYFTLIGFKTPQGDQIFCSKGGGPRFPQTSLQQR